MAFAINIKIHTVHLVVEGHGDNTVSIYHYTLKMTSLTLLYSILKYCISLSLICSSVKENLLIVSMTSALVQKQL